MTSFDDQLNEIAFLTRSATRTRIVRNLYRNGPTDVSALRHRFDCDRTTLQRNLNVLVEHGWVQQMNGTYRITQAGELLVTGLIEFVDLVGTAMKLQPFLRWMPDETLDFDPRQLADAEIAVSDSTDPYAPVNRHIKMMEQAEYYRCLLPAVGLQPMSVARDCVARGKKHEVVFDPQVAETIQENPEYSALLEELRESDRCELFVADDPIPFHLGLMGDRVQIGVEDDTGTPYALVETEQITVRAWAEETYKKYKQRALALDGESRPDSEVPS